jgi:hypothetical protein
MIMKYKKNAQKNELNSQHIYIYIFTHLYLHIVMCVYICDDSKMSEWV